MNEKDLNPMTEAGFISDTLKDITDIDINAIQKDIQDNKPGQGKGVQGVANVRSSMANKGIAPAGAAASELDKMISKGRVDNRSIFARARNSVMQFPCYVTQTIPVNPAQIIAKTFERVYASFVQAAIAQYKIIDENEANDLLFLKRFHTNIKESAEVLYNGFYEPIDEFDSIMRESVFHKEQLTPTMSVEFSVLPESASEYLVKESHRLSAEPLEGFAYLQEADGQGFLARKKAARDRAEYNAQHDREDTEEKMTQKTPLTKDEVFDVICNRLHLSSNDRDILKEDLVKDKNGNVDPATSKIKRALQIKFDKALDEFKDDIKQGSVAGYAIDSAGRIIRVSTSTKKTSKGVIGRAPDTIKGPDAPVLLREVDIKKLNSMAPYMIQCHFIIRSQGKLDTEAHYLIGVKTIMHLIRPQDLSEDLRDLVTGRIKSLQKVRYKTGETSWWEYMFHKKQIKKDAGKAINYNKKWINTLKRLSEFDKANGSLMRGPIAGLNKGDIPIPNATLILSQPDVTRLSNETGIDLSVVSNAVRLARSLFLIAVVIVDASAGTMRYIFPDNMVDWDVQSLASMEAEVAKTDNSQLMRELNHLVNK